MKAARIHTRIGCSPFICASKVCNRSSPAPDERSSPSFSQRHPAIVMGVLGRGPMQANFLPPAKTVSSAHQQSPCPTRIPEFGSVRWSSICILPCIALSISHSHRCFHGIRAIDSRGSSREGRNRRRHRPSPCHSRRTRPPTPEGSPPHPAPRHHKARSSGRRIR